MAIWLRYQPCLLTVCLCSQSHRRQHNKDKPFKCHHCNRGYTDSASLEVHLSTHTVKHAKLYSCGLCNRTYTSVWPWPRLRASPYTPWSAFSVFSVMIQLFVRLLTGNIPDQAHAETLPRPGTHPADWSSARPQSRARRRCWRRRQCRRRFSESCREDQRLPTARGSAMCIWPAAVQTSGGARCFI